MGIGTNASLSWTVDVSPTCTRITFSGEFDLAAADGLQDCFTGVLSDAEGTVIIGLDLEFMDSTGLRFLLDIKRTLDGQGVELVLERVSPAVQRVLEVAGLTSWFVSDPESAPTG